MTRRSNGFLTNQRLKSQCHNGPPATSADGGQRFQQISEELEVERIELQAEHRCLIEATRDLERSRDQYVDLFEIAPCGFAALNHRGIIANINIPGARLLNHDRL